MFAPSPTEAIAMLSLLVERGPRAFDDVPRYQLDLIKRLCISAITPEALLDDKDFGMALHLGVVRVFATHPSESITATQKKFQNELEEIFSQTLPTLPILLIARMLARILAEAKRPSRSAEEEDRELQEMHLRRSKVLENVRLHENFTSERAHFNGGTSTQLVACPSCGTQKRVDRNTKRFRCKAASCTFDQPYPLPRP